MEIINFSLFEGESYIPLIALLKATNVAFSGSEAQDMVSSGMVLRNGVKELRKRAKIVAGEEIVIDNICIRVQ